MPVLDEIDHRKLLNEDRQTVDRFLVGLEALALRIARQQYRFRPDEAEDILLDVLRKLWDADKAALRAWRGEGSLRTYLTAIVHRFCLMELRRRRRRVVESTTEELDGFHARHQPPPLEQQQLRSVYRQAANELPSRDRRLIQMRFVEELDYPAITAELGISHGAARKAVHTALNRLRERMREIAPELFQPSMAS